MVNFQLIAFLVITFVYFLLRLINLDQFPVFVDEAIYIRWSQLINAEPTLRFVPLQDGKQPLFMWLAAVFLKFFSDPLVAGRLVSVFAGFGTMIGVAALVWLLGKKVSHGLWGMVLVSIVPYSLFFDRLALVDSLLACFGVWSVLLAILLGREKRLDLAMILGIVVGLAMITKSPGMYFLLFLPIVVFFYGFKKENKRSLAHLGGLLLVSAVFSLAIYSILRLGPNFHMIGLRNKDYVWPLSQIVKHPLDPLIPHLKDAFRYYWSYLTLPVVVLAFVGMFIEGKRNFGSLSLILWWLVPLVGQSAIAKTFTARYVLYGVPVFLVFAAIAIGWFWQKLKSSRARVVFLLGLFVLVFRFDYLLLFSPEATPLPRDEKKGYLEDWSSGWGIKESANYFKSLSKDIPILVGTEGYFGTLPDGLQIYLDKEPEVSVIGVGYPVSAVPKSLLENLEAGNRSYLLVNESRFLVTEKSDLSLISEYLKPGGDKLLLFELKK